MKPLSDGDREILAELERLARPSAADLDDLLESADCIEDVFGELLDAISYDPEPPGQTGPTADPDYPW